MAFLIFYTMIYYIYINEELNDIPYSLWILIHDFYPKYVTYLILENGMNIMVVLGSGKH